MHGRMAKVCLKLAAHCEDFEQLSVGNWLELKIEHVQSSLVSRN